MKWNKKKEELKQEDKSEIEKAEAKNDFADLSALTCLLCQRKFKSKVDLSRHIELSNLHKVTKTCYSVLFFLWRLKKKVSSFSFFFVLLE